MAVRLIYNEPDRFPNPIPVPPPPSTRPEILQDLRVPIRAIPGHRDLMHHKYVVRDRQDVWTGSMNWTLDSWTRQENIVALVENNGGIAQAYTKDFEQLWRSGDVDESGTFDPPRGDLRAWFTPGRGEDLSHHIAGTIARARARIRVASPVITSAPIISTLAQVAGEQRVDLAGVVDGTQMRQVFQQWQTNGNSEWKIPVVRSFLLNAPFAAKPSTPYTPESVHDYMHAKVTVADNHTFIGSFNLSRSGEMNAENVLEIHSADIANRMVAFIDSIRARYAQFTDGQGSPAAPRRETLRRLRLPRRRRR